MKRTILLYLIVTMLLMTGCGSPRLNREAHVFVDVSGSTEAKRQQILGHLIRIGQRYERIRLYRFSATVEEVYAGEAHSRAFQKVAVDTINATLASHGATNYEAAISKAAEISRGVESDMFFLGDGMAERGLTMEYRAAAKSLEANEKVGRIVFWPVPVARAGTDAREQIRHAFGASKRVHVYHPTQDPLK